MLEEVVRDRPVMLNTRSMQLLPHPTNQPGTAHWGAPVGT